MCPQKGQKKGVSPKNHVRSINANTGLWGASPGLHESCRAAIESLEMTCLYFFAKQIFNIKQPGLGDCEEVNTAQGLLIVYRGRSDRRTDFAVANTRPLPFRNDPV